MSDNPFSGVRHHGEPSSPGSPSMKRRSIISTLRDKVSAVTAQTSSLTTDTRRRSSNLRTGLDPGANKIFNYFLATAHARPCVGAGHMESLHSVMLDQEKALGFGELSVCLEVRGAKRASGFVLLGRSAGFFYVPGDEAGVKNILAYFPYNSVVEWCLTSSPSCLRVKIENGKLGPLDFFSSEPEGDLECLVMLLDRAMLRWSWQMQHLESSHGTDSQDDAPSLDMEPLLYDLRGEREAESSFSSRQNFVDGNRFLVNWMMSFAKKPEGKTHTAPAVLVVSPFGLLVMLPVQRILVPLFYHELSDFAEKRRVFSFALSYCFQNQDISQTWSFSVHETLEAAPILRAIEEGVHAHRRGSHGPCWPKVYPPLDAADIKVMRACQSVQSDDEAVTLDATVASMHEKRSRVALERLLTRGGDSLAHEAHESFWRKFVDAQYYHTKPTHSSQDSSASESKLSGSPLSSSSKGGGLLGSLRGRDKAKRMSLQLSAGDVEQVRGNRLSIPSSESGDLLTSSAGSGIRLPAITADRSGGGGELQLPPAGSSSRSTKNPSPFASDEEPDVHVIVHKKSPRRHDVKTTPPTTASPKRAPETLKPAAATSADRRGLSGALDMLQRELEQLKADGLLAGDAAGGDEETDDEDAKDDNGRDDESESETVRKPAAVKLVVVAPRKPPITPQRGGDADSSSSSVEEVRKTNPGAAAPPMTPQKTEVLSESSTLSASEEDEDDYVGPPKKVASVSSVRSAPAVVAAKRSTTLSDKDDDDDDDDEEEFDYVEEYVEVEVSDEESPAKKPEVVAAVSPKKVVDVPLVPPKPTSPLIPPRPKVALPPPGKVPNTRAAEVATPEPPKIFVEPAPPTTTAEVPVTIEQQPRVDPPITHQDEPIKVEDPIEAPPPSNVETWSSSAPQIPKDDDASSSAGDGGDIDSDIINSDSDVSD